MKIKQVTLQVPVVTLDFTSYVEGINSFLANFVNKSKNVVISIYRLIKGFIRRQRTEENPSQNIQSDRRFRLPTINNRKFFRNLFIIIAVPLLFMAVIKLYKDAALKNSTGSRIEVKGAIAEQPVNKEFSFPLKNEKGEEVSRIKYLVEKVELKDEIITGGKRATAVKGRLFLILILKITNEFQKPIEINTRDYVRLSVNGNETELLAPETHNDPVEVQAISTKNTRVGFIINDTDSNFVLHLGEIQSEKEKIDLDLK